MGQLDCDRLYRDWDPGRAAAEETAQAPDDATRAWPAAADPSAAGFRPESSMLASPLAAFTLHEPGEPGNPLDLFAATRPAFIDEAALGGEPGGFRAAMAAALAGPPGADSDPFPQPGDGIAGFRLLSELGRGAFGRVFLAEESLLGNRLVALKVTRAEGDEPRILARLQHTHIVPIHSVRDDPRTGLRVMCMPYVGGANLAQVLEASAVGLGPGGDQRSLLRALDIVGLPPPSESAVPVGARRRRATPEPLGSGLEGHQLPAPEAAGPLAPRRGGPPARAEASPSGADGPAGTISTRRRSLLGRLPTWSRSFVRVARSRPGAQATAAPPRDPVQPARRFLREASFIRSAAWIVARLAEGLEHAHAHGLLHRDLKPSNILIAADGTPMLLDFNLAADTTIRAEEGDKARMGGTLPYMAPEHLDAFHPEGTTPPEAVDERSDVYALGLILFEMIAGLRPFAEPDPGRPLLEAIRVMIAEREAGPPSARAACPGVPRDLDAILRKALQPDPNRRHARAGDLAEDLQRFLDDRPLRFTPEPIAWGRAAKWVRRNPRATGASTVGLVGLALIIGLSLAAWTVGRHLTEASVRLRLNAFRDHFPECQFALNTVGGPTASLGRGITLADEALAQAGITLDPHDPAAADGWLDGLAPAERAEVGRDLAEVILLVCRARVYLADRARSPAQQRQAAAAAVAWLDRAEAIDPTPTPTLYDDRANYLDRIGRRDRAAAERARRDATPPTTGRDYYLLGTSLQGRGELDRAEAALIRATALSPRGFWPWFALGLCHYDQRRFAEAAGDFAVCSVLSPRFAWPWMNRGLALARVGRLVEARAAFDRAIEVDETLVDALANRGLVALELDDAPAAVADLERAVALGRREVDLQASLGEALGRSGRRAEAFDLLDDLIRTHPGVILPRIARGALLAGEDPGRAEDDFRHVLRVAPRHPEALLGLARLHRGPRPREALAEATQALEADPNKVDALELRALLCGKLGEAAVIADVERLARTPTARRLYNAGCSLALYAGRHPDPALVGRATGYLRRAVQLGIAPTQLRDDPDLAALRGHPPFEALLLSSPAADCPGDP